MNSLKKVIFVAPFWRQDGHVGNLRIDRFLRWIAEDEFHIVMGEALHHLLAPERNTDALAKIMRVLIEKPESWPWVTAKEVIGCPLRMT